MTFATPWAFLLLLLLPIIIYRYFSRSRLGLRRGKVLFPFTAPVETTGKSLRTRLKHLPFFLRLATLILLTIGLARPLEGLEKFYDLNKGVAIEVVIDRSSSMNAEMIFAGQQLNRLEVAKRVLHEFIRGNSKDLAGRPNDLIGLISFARYADTACPLTLAHDGLASFIEPIRLVNRKQEDGTAIGDALALAAARLRQAEDTIKQQMLTDDRIEPSYEIQSKIIILLTDGEQTAGKRTPEEAASLAKQWGIKIYAIGIGGPEALVKVPSLFGTGLIRRGSGVDSATLSMLARETGGIFRMAEDGESLQAVYAEIDRLEKSEMESMRYVDYKERFMIFALGALVTFVLEIVLQTTWLRKIP